MHIKLIRVFVEGSWHQDLVAAVPGRLAKKCWDFSSACDLHRTWPIGWWNRWKQTQLLIWSQIVVGFPWFWDAKWCVSATKDGTMQRVAQNTKWRHWSTTGAALWSMAISWFCYCKDTCLKLANLLHGLCVGQEIVHPRGTCWKLPWDKRWISGVSRISKTKRCETSTKIVKRMWQKKVWSIVPLPEATRPALSDVKFQMHSEAARQMSANTFHHAQPTCNSAGQCVHLHHVSHLSLSRQSRRFQKQTWWFQPEKWWIKWDHRLK